MQQEKANKHKIQFLSHRNATSAKAVMSNLLRRKIFVGADRSVVLDQFWAQGESEEQNQRPPQSSCGHTKQHAHTDAAAAAAGGCDRIRVLLIGFEDSQVCSCPHHTPSARSRVPISPCGSHRQRSISSWIQSDLPTVDNRHDIRESDTVPVLLVCSTQALARMTSAHRSTLTDTGCSRCQISEALLERVSMFKLRRSQTVTGCQ